ncbi:uncharacterized protein M6B38_116450 [Iris pallida]|uniref:UspA domain-containing protein n=1 Tax=Iris pallida TaxID=29817 RepID=A0AAX6I5U5_IRIPA|nr:uncharacterized protein M6B38_116450 [Iris pallida]
MEGGVVWEIEEEEEEAVAVDAAPSGSALRVQAGLGGRPANDVRVDDDVYVAVGKSGSSMEALSWALTHVAKPSSFVYLIHVFPEIRHISTPLGMLPKSRVSPQQVEAFMSQERSKRREMLQKLLNLCQAYKVQVDTLLIESDQVVKAVLELIPVLNIKRIFVGASKSNIRKLKGTSKAELIHKSAPSYCEVKIICEGKEVTAVTNQRAVHSAHSGFSDGNTKDDNLQEGKDRDLISCICFSSKFSK